MSEGTPQAPVSAPTQTNEVRTGSNVPPQGSTGLNVGQPRGQQAPQQSQIPAEAPKGDIGKPEPEYFEVMVKGKPVRMTRQEALDRASMASHANDRFNEATQKEKRVQRIIDTAKANPIDALMDPELGLSKDQIRDAFEKWYHQEYIEPESLSEDQKRNRDLEKRIKAFEQEEETRKKAAEQEHLEKLTQNEQKYLQETIINALESSKLPKTPKIVARLAFYMRQNLSNGWDAPMDMIVRQVQAERQDDFGGDMEGMSVPEFISMYGPKGEAFIKKVNAFYVNQMREKRAQQTQSFSSSHQSNQTADDDRKRVYSTDVQKNLRRMQTGK